MRKWLYLFAALLLLISLGFLPGVVGVLQDTGSEKTVLHRPLHSIAPYLSESGSGMDFLDKLGILNACEVSAITPAMASMTEQQVRAAIEAGVQPYVEAGLFRSVTAWECSAVTPFVALSWRDVQQYFLFWTVHLTETVGDHQYSLFVQVDDETGKFLYMEYVDPFALEEQPLWEEKWLPLERFGRIWLEQAGLLPSVQVAAPGYESQQSVGTDPDRRMIVYTVTDGAGRPLYINFSLSAFGAYSMWSESFPQ